MRRTLVASILLVALAAAPPALAHGDAPSLKDHGTLAPGDEVRMTRQLHWHRLVGNIESPAVDQLVLRVDGPNGTTRIPVDGHGIVNTVIRCCLGTVWAEHTITLRNNGSTPQAYRVDIALLHDDFTVLADGAEGGSGVGVLVLASLAAAAAWRARPTGTPDVGAARRSTRVSTFAISTAWGLMAALALYGLLRYGGGPLLGTLTAFALFPLANPTLNSHLAGMLVLFALWLTALFAWSGAQRRSPRRNPTTGTLALGILIGGPLFTLFFILEFGNPGLAAAYGLVPPAAFILAWAVPRRRDPQPAAP